MTDLCPQAARAFFRGNPKFVSAARTTTDTGIRALVPGERARAAGFDAPAAWGRPPPPPLPGDLLARSGASWAELCRGCAGDSPASAGHSTPPPQTTQTTP